MAESAAMPVHYGKTEGKVLSMSRNTAIIADSSSNLFTGAFADFTAVPLKIITAEKEFVDNEQLDVAQMCAFLQEYKGKSGTACPSVGDWQQAFGGAQEVYGFSITSHLSGCYNAACIAAKEYRAEDSSRKVYIMDTLTTGPELELLVEKCGELIAQGLSFEEIKAALQQYLQKTHLIFSLESLNNFAKNGRVSPALAVAASLLGIRIVGRASAEGELEPMHKCRGEKRAIRHLLEIMRTSGFAGGKVRIRHSDNAAMAQTVAEEIRADYPNADIQIGENNGLCAYYAEKGGLLIGFEG